MGMTAMTWEDDTNNRRVALTAEFSVDGESLAVRKLTPTHVTFLCPTSGSTLRTIRVWTAKGRQLLENAFRTSDQFDAVMAEVIETHLGTVRV